MKWLQKARRRAVRTKLSPTSECRVESNLMLEADADSVVLSLVDGSANRGFRSRWTRDEAQRICLALARWLETGSLEE